MLQITTSKCQYLEENASLDIVFSLLLECSVHTFIKKDLSALCLYLSFPYIVKISLQPKSYLMNCCNPFSSLILKLFSVVFTLQINPSLW